MSWQISVQLDHDSNDVGVISATWTDPNIALGIFTVSERIQATTANLNAFVAATIAARNAWQSKQTANINDAAIALAAFKAADIQPQ